MAKKFVINDGYLILGDVEFHEDLVKSKCRNKSKTVGGGMWHFDKPNNTIYFWGHSVDYGQVTKEQLDAAFKQPSIENAKIVFTTDLKSPI